MREATGCVVRHLLWLVALLIISFPAHAAVIAGRVVDGDGRPVAGAEVRIWQKMPGATDQTVSDQPVRFADGDGGEVLHTDSDGRFQTPDVVVPEAFARVFADAEGMLTARGDWVEIRQETNPHVIEVVMRRLRIVEGRVVDSEGRPIAGATVFHVGDGPEKLITQTDLAGKFQLLLVPEGPAFLFAEKPGYRFTGMLLTNGSDAAITLVQIDEPIEPLRTLPPLLPYDEEIGLVREMVERALVAAKSGTQDQKRMALLALCEIDPVGTFDRAAALDYKGVRGFIDYQCAALCIAGRANLSWDDLRTYLEISDSHAYVAHHLCDGASRMGDEERARRLEWLDEALLHARHIEDARGRAQALAVVGGAFAQACQREHAIQIITEAEKELESVQSEPLRRVRIFEALASAHVRLDPSRAAEWLERIDEPSISIRWAGETAVRLLPAHPDIAEDLWRRAHARAATLKPTRYDLHGWELVNIADLCYRLAKIDQGRAERLARNERFGPTRLRGLGGVALALSEADRDAARRLLASLIRDELPQLPSDEGGISRLDAPPMTAAWLLPMAERIDPQLARECFWRSLALRRPRPTHDDFDDVAEEPDTELAKMLARYDREVARALLEPMAARLPQISAPIATSLNGPPAWSVRAFANHKRRYILIAAALIDARWAMELAASLPSSANRFDSSEHYLAATLGPPYDERWTGEAYDARWVNYGAFGAGYWELPTGGASKREYHAKIR